MNIEKLYSTARGGKWYGRPIKYMLENPFYRGTAHYKGNKVKNKELALVYGLCFYYRVNNAYFLHR